jgi:hypothetical protein
MATRKRAFARADDGPQVAGAGPKCGHASDVRGPVGIMFHNADQRGTSAGNVTRVTPAQEPQLYSCQSPKDCSNARSRCRTPGVVQTNLDSASVVKPSAVLFPIFCLISA